MSVTLSKADIRTQMRVLEQDLVSTSDGILDQYIDFAIPVVEAEVDDTKQDIAVLYLALHYTVVSKGGVEDTGSKTGVRVASKKVDDVEIKYFDLAAKVVRTKYLSMYETLCGTEPGGKVKRAVSYQGWA